MLKRIRMKHNFIVFFGEAYGISMYAEQNMKLTTRTAKAR
jgi:hypothetical protein